MSVPSSTLSEVRNSRGVGVGLVREFVRVTPGITHVLHKGQYCWPVQLPLHVGEVKMVMAI